MTKTTNTASTKTGSTKTDNTKDTQSIKHFNKVSVHIQEQLRLAGFNVTLRTVQRDLLALSQRFLIEHNNSNPKGWRWRDDAPLQSMPNMSLPQAVAFQMMEKNLVQLLPPAILKELHPWFDLAKRQLREESTIQSWLDKVHIEPPTLSLIPPNIDSNI